jgi:hypothetical protein
VTQGRQTSDTVAAIADELVRWGKAQGFVHGEVCIDTAQLILNNPRSVIRSW